MTSNARSSHIETVAPTVRRLVAPNPGPMTFHGTNTYLVGERCVAIIDPGPDEPAHRAAILDAVGDAARVEAVLVTHAHLDHSAGAAALAAATGAPTLAFGRFGDGRSAEMAALADQGIGGGEGGDLTFAPDRRLTDGERVAGDGRSAADRWRLTALHTPGHTSDHLCYALTNAEDQPIALFSGDLVMGWSTSLISPPDGDMRAFMQSLERLRARGQDGPYLPGHGEPIITPKDRVIELYDHRKKREAQILEALEEGLPAEPAALARSIYGDLNPTLLPAAERNVLAHLIHLEIIDSKAAQN